MVVGGNSLLNGFCDRLNIDLSSKIPPVTWTPFRTAWCDRLDPPFGWCREDHLVIQKLCTVTPLTLLDQGAFSWTRFCGWILGCPRYDIRYTPFFFVWKPVSGWGMKFKNNPICTVEGNISASVVPSQCSVFKGASPFSYHLGLHPWTHLGFCPQIP